MKLNFTAKCSDLSITELLDNDGNLIAEREGYVPYNLGIGGGDYVSFTLDLDTMTIVGYKVKPEDIQDFIDGSEACE